MPPPKAMRLIRSWTLVTVLLLLGTVNCYLSSASDSIGNSGQAAAFSRDEPKLTTTTSQRSFPSSASGTSWSTTKAKDGETTTSLQGEILNLFGVEHRPRPNLFYRFQGKEPSARTYMRELYNRVAQNASLDEFGDEDAAHGFICNHTLVNGAHADTVVSFMNHAVIPRPNTTVTEEAFYFNLATDVVFEKVLSSELRLYFDGESRGMALKRNHLVKVKLFQVIKPEVLYNHIHTRVVDVRQAKWQTFDLSNSVVVWSEIPDSNNGIVIRCETLDRKYVDCQQTGLVDFSGPVESRPFLVTYYQTQYEADALVKTTRSARRSYHRQKRSVQDFIRRVIESDSTWSDWLLGSSVESAWRRKRSGLERCRRQSLYVSFTDLGWADWIIAPEGYYAHYCNGECSFPLGAKMNATNHAIVQTLVHLISSKSIPQPCCAPTRLSAISVLYLDDRANVVMRNYQNMVVKACGCH